MKQINNLLFWLLLATVCSPKPANAAVSRDSILGKWQIFVTMPTYKNSIAEKYNRLTFSKDGTVEVELKKNQPDKYEWEFKDGIYLAKYSFNDFQYTVYYKLASNDELEQFKLLKSKDGNSKEKNISFRWIRQGSALAKTKNIVHIFDELEGTENRQNNNTLPEDLKKGTTYKIYKKTPLLKHYERKKRSKSKVEYLPPHTSITILAKKKYHDKLWIRVKSSTKKKGWIKSEALADQLVKKIKDQLN